MDKEIEHSVHKTVENQAEEECEQAGSNRYDGLIYEMIDMQYADFTDAEIDWPSIAYGKVDNQVEECDHVKVYSDYLIMTKPPQCEWICKKCGKTGIDQLEQTFASEYEYWKNKWEKKTGDETK